MITPWPDFATLPFDAAAFDDADALQAAAVAERATADSLAIAKRQVELGDIGYVALLASEQAYQQALTNLVQAQANRYTDTAALFQALGGGWWNRTELAVAAPSADKQP